MFDTVAEVLFALSLLVNAVLFVPQAVRLYRTKDANGVSVWTFAGFNVLQAISVMHGVITGDRVLAWGYILSFVCCGAVTVLTIYYKTRSNNQ